jgi:hypothetical protein
MPPSPSSTPLLWSEVAVLDYINFPADQTPPRVALPEDLPPPYSPPGLYSSPSSSASSCSSLSLPPPPPPYSPPDTPLRSLDLLPRQLAFEPLLLPGIFSGLALPPPVYTPPTPLAAAPMSSRQASLLSAAQAGQLGETVEEEEEAQLHALLLKAITAQHANRHCTPAELAAKAQYAVARFVEEEVTSVDVLRELKASDYKEVGLSIGLMLVVQRILRVA